MLQKMTYYFGMENKLLVLEVGLLLDKKIEHYMKILESANAKNEYNCITHDLYWTNKTQEELMKMSENQIKKSCVRYRFGNGFGGEKLEKKQPTKMGKFDNYQIFDKEKNDRFDEKVRKIKKYNKNFEKHGWRLIFDTIKTDYQYSIENMKSRIQIQDIKDLGLVLYYDNPDYYHLPEEEQRLALIRELNSYGFDFNEDILGIDKLKTFVHGTNMFSKNQNG